MSGETISREAVERVAKRMRESHARNGVQISQEQARRRVAQALNNEERRRSGG